MNHPQGTGSVVCREGGGREVFERFLKAVEQRPWNEVLHQVEAEIQRIMQELRRPDKYLPRLMRLRSYLPTSAGIAKLANAPRSAFNRPPCGPCHP
jgi:hypothetical protein